MYIRNDTDQMFWFSHKSSGGGVGCGTIKAHSETAFPTLNNIISLTFSADTGRTIPNNTAFVVGPIISEKAAKPQEQQEYEEHQEQQ